MLATLGAWFAKGAAKLGLTALYNIVKAAVDSFFESRRKSKERRLLEEQVEDQFIAEKKGETLDELKERTRDRQEVEERHSDDSWDDTLDRMRRGLDRKGKRYKD